MKDHEFHYGNIPDGFRLNFHPSIFNLPEHLRLQAFEGWHAFYIINFKSKKVEACVYLHVENFRASSPRSAPFGSVEFSDNVSPATLFKFIDFIENKLAKLGVREILIKNPPHIYNPGKLSQLHVLLLNAGYHIELAEPGACIAISDKSFSDIIRKSENQVLTQAKKSGLICKSISLEEISTVYSFLRKHLTKKGYTLSMTLDDLQDTVDVFSDDFYLFGVFDKKELVAASVSIKVSEHTLYNFYIAHNPDYNSLSPVIMIVEALYQLAQKNTLGILDLGTSAIKGKPNFPLLEFKLRLGAVASEKFTFLKTIK